mmetsp:Transcript_21193/g.32006  ORF Transcript_21193/g.32006 Transcript_21193/m.32006 type:complete len:167 (+) Transcript_21193:525-1025(+)
MKSLRVVLQQKLLPASLANLENDNLDNENESNDHFNSSTLSCNEVSSDDMKRDAQQECSREDKEQPGICQVDGRAKGGLTRSEQERYNRDNVEEYRRLRRDLIRAFSYDFGDDGDDLSDATESTVVSDDAEWTGSKGRHNWKMIRFIILGLLGRAQIPFWGHGYVG